MDPFVAVRRIGLCYLPFLVDKLEFVQSAWRPIQYALSFIAVLLSICNSRDYPQTRRTLITKITAPTLSILRFMAKFGVLSLSILGIYA